MQFFFQLLEMCMLYIPNHEIFSTALINQHQDVAFATRVIKYFGLAKPNSFPFYKLRKCDSWSKIEKHHQNHPKSTVQQAFVLDLFMKHKAK